MQRKLQRKIIKLNLLILAFYTIFISLSYSQELSLDESLYNTLIETEFKPSYQSLSSSEQSIYPQNILLYLPKNTVSQNTSSISKTKKLETLLITFTQEDIKSDTQGFLTFLRTLEAKELPLDILITLTANDNIGKILFPHSENHHPSGTEAIASYITNTENTCAIAIIKGENNRIVSGGSGLTSPLWLVKKIKDSCTENNIKTWLPNSATFLYRLRFTREDERVSPFFDASIPAIGLYTKQIQDSYTVLATVAEKLSVTNISAWDSHYSYISFFGIEFWLNETFYLFFYIIFSFIVLFSACFTGFSSSNKNRALLRDLSRNWYQIVLIITITALSLYFSNKIKFLHFPLAIINLGVELVFVMLISLIIFTIQSGLKILVAYEACSRLVLFSSIINIFIFTCIDISFLFLFSFEYIACYIAKNAKTKPSIIFSLILMILPFIPQTANILFAAAPRTLKRITDIDILGTLLISVALFPFQIQFFRLLILMDIFGNRKKNTIILKIIRIIVFIASSVAAFIGLYLAILSSIIYIGISKNLFLIPRKPIATQKSFIQDNSKDFVELSFSQSDFAEYAFNSLLISNETKDSHSCKILRYDIKIETESGVPLNDCNYPYSLLGRHKAYIELPDYPAAPVSIVFTNEKKVSFVITVDSYLQTEDGTFIIESDRIAAGGK